MSAVFVTGTGTDVGKTFVVGALVRHLRSAGQSVEAIKPVVSGFDSGMLAGSDPGLLLAALGRRATMEEIDRISPWRFSAPMSPDLAAEREFRSIDYSKLLTFCSRTAAKTSGHLLIEGIGGIMVPLDRSHTVLDWITALRIPILLVAGSYLGTISHTLSALYVLTRRNLDIAAVIVSESEKAGASLDQSVATIARFSDSIDVIGIPRLRERASEHPVFARIAALL